MVDPKLFKQLGEFLDQYSKKRKPKNQSLSDFLIWTQENILSNEPLPGNEQVQLIFLISALSKAYHHKSKHIIKKAGFKNLDEFHLIATLYYADNIRKMDLINLNLIEKPTGTEILKRLINNGLIAEKKDPFDGRAQRIRLTELGTHTFEILLPKMKDFTNKMCSGFSKNKIESIVNFLRILYGNHKKKVRITSSRNE